MKYLFSYKKSDNTNRLIIIQSVADIGGYTPTKITFGLTQVSQVKNGNIMVLPFPDHCSALLNRCSALRNCCSALQNCCSALRNCCSSPRNLCLCYPEQQFGNWFNSGEQRLQFVAVVLLFSFLIFLRHRYLREKWFSLPSTCWVHT